MDLSNCLNENKKAMMKNDNVKTAIRWRPSTENREIVIEKLADNLIHIMSNSNPGPYMVDNVFNSSDQTEVFYVLVKPFIDKAIEGFNFTFLATGQTGSGKTYTMGFEKSVNPENSGIVTRVLNSLFTHENADNFKIEIAFIEVYNDQAFDLLSSNSQKPFYTKVDSKKSNATKQTVNTEANVLTLLAAGTEKRRIRRTNMNSVSSRSHVIFTIYLSITQNEGFVRKSVINLVDLAGSESSQKSGNTGQAHAEGKSINEGLNSFKRVINALIESNDRHIPFRDSVITYLLKDSLDRNSYLTLLGCVSPYREDYGETLSTLKFVCEAKKMKLTPQLKEIYKKSMTPVKQIDVKQKFNASNSLLKSTPLFKQPKPFANIQNKLKQMSEPRPKRIVSTKRILNRMSAIHSTTKKASFIHSNRSPRSSSAKKPKAVAQLFPTKANDTTFENISINANWSNVSTSSVIEIGSSPIKPSKPEPNIQQSTLLQPNIQKLAQILSGFNTPERKKMVDDALKVARSNKVIENEKETEKVNKESIDLKDIKPSMIQTLVSSPPPPSSLPSVESVENCADPSMTIETTVEKCELTTCENDSNLDYTNDTNDQQHVTMIEKDLTHMNAIDIPLDVAPNDENILLTIATDHIPVDSPKPDAIEQFEIPDQFSLGAITEVSEVNSTNEAPEKTIEMSIIASPSVELGLDSISIAKSELSQIFDDSVPTMVNENPATFVSPLVIRKLELPTEQSMYGIVKNGRIHQAEIENQVEYSYAEVENSFAEQQQMNEYSERSIEETIKTPQAPVKTPAIVRSKRIRFPFSPRIILHRIEDIREYQENMKRVSSEIDTVDSQKAKRVKITRTESIRKPLRGRPAAKTTKTTKATKAKRKPISSTASHSTSNVSSSIAVILKETHNKILNILNTGTEKDLQNKLSTIGKKKATQIYNYRVNFQRQFKDIDDMKKMPFWTVKCHQNFLINNNLVAEGL